MRSRLQLVAVVVIVVATMLAVTPGASPAPLFDEPAAPPNIVLFFVDDQRSDQLSFMSTVMQDVAGRGVHFTEAFAVNPLCCPSRVSVLRGQFSHSTRIYRNRRIYGGFDYAKKIGVDQSTIATWLQASGYRTALMGKYLNGYSGDAKLTYVPPGWDVWRAFETNPSNVPFFNYRMSVDGATQQFGSTDQDYSTDVIASMADDFIRETPADQPLFLYATPVAPHTPRTPAPRHAMAACPARAITPSVGEPDVTDKPSFIQSLPWDTTKLNQAKNTWTKGCRSLYAVDDAVDTVLQALTDTGRLPNTLFVYASDNGHLLGEHRYFGKTVAYEESIRIPVAIRWDAVVAQPGSVDGRMVGNIDLTATFVDAAGVTPPFAMEGMSLLPLLRGDGVAWRTDLLIEHFDTAGTEGFIPTYCAVRTQTELFVRYDPDDVSVMVEELYDLATDPYQLTNLPAGAPAAEIAARRDELLARTEELCQPPPPSYAF